MKQILYFFVYLNIYTCFFFGIKAQELSLSIKSEKLITEATLDSLQMQTNFSDFASLKKETDTIHLKIQRMGYIESELLEIQKENDSSYTAHFFFGKKYNELKIFYSEEDFNQKELQRVTSEITDTYFILPFETIPNSLKKLTALRNQKGNAFARLRLIDFTKDENDKLSATLAVANGNIRIVDSIAIKGYEKFPQSFIRYYAGVKKGAVFNQQKLITQNENLNSLGFVSTIKPPEALFRKDSTVVYFYLEKQNNNLFDGILGFATNEDTQKLEFNGYLNLELNNNLNYGEQLLINYKSDGKEQVNFRTKLTLPYVFKTPFGVSGELKIFKRDSTFITTEQQLKATYQINPTSTTYIGYRSYDSSNLLDIAVAGNPVENFKSKFLIAGATYLKPQNKILFPIKTAISIDAGIGIRDTEGKTEDQLRVEATLNNIFNLNFKNSIFLQNITSVLFSDTYLVNELFRFGGINSIRGFNENSIDASLFSILNTEYRYQFNDGVYIHSIIDFGYFENETQSLKQNLYSYGVGLGLNTKAGLFKFNIANGNSDSQDFNFSNTKIHISVSSKF
ncbi:ShlB/FhaC/HecB family hemolysin secretion/activation protein [Aequorivita sp. Q41]|uniref:POTRA domain-containing protein n=1 Tax=Aequorivita sp. Q41 TaxID=3153300 RepID=UPI003241F191